MLRGLPMDSPDEERLPRHYESVSITAEPTLYHLKYTPYSPTIPQFAPPEGTAIHPTKEHHPLTDYKLNALPLFPLVTFDELTTRFLEGCSSASFTLRPPGPHALSRRTSGLHVSFPCFFFFLFPPRVLIVLQTGNPPLQVFFT